MSRIIWNDSFSVNNRCIDEQHKQWVVIINELHDALIGSVNIGKDAVIDSLTAMDDYTRFHFAHEEEFMRRVNYPEYDAHVKIHESFLNTVSEYVDSIWNERLVLNTEMMGVLMNWLQQHILEEDMKFSSYGEG